MLLLLALLLALASTSLADCPPGTIYEDHLSKCYKYYSTPLPYLAAERQCNSIGGNLVAVLNGFENNYVSEIASRATGYTSNFWIGANQMLAALWSWTDNNSMSYTNWATGQPGAAYPCGLIRNSDSKWISGACNSALPFVCAVDPNAPQPGSCSTQPPAPTSPSSVCPGTCSPGYSLFVGNCMCYKYDNSTYYNYTDAAIACAHEGSTLVKIDTPGLNNFLTNLPGFGTRGQTCPWIGLTCLNTSYSSCTWPDGSDVTYWNIWNGGPTSDKYRFVLVANTDVTDSGTWGMVDRILTYSTLCQQPSRYTPLLKMAAQENNEESTFQRTADTS